MTSDMSPESGSDIPHEVLNSNTPDLTKNRYFCYLAINRTIYKKVVTHVSVSKNPLVRVNQKNESEKSKRPSSKENERWELNMVIGSFPTREMAMTFCKEWRQDARGIPSRRKKGMKLVADHNLRTGFKIECIELIQTLTRNDENITSDPKRFFSIMGSCDAFARISQFLPEEQILDLITRHHRSTLCDLSLLELTVYDAWYQLEQVNTEEQ